MVDPRKLCFDILGKLIIPDPDNEGETKAVVYQGTSAQFANYTAGNKRPRMVREYVIQTPSNTPDQVTQREKMRIAVAMWQTATPEEKEEARPIAIEKNIPLYHAFLSLQIKQIEPVLGTIWDAGATVWIDGSTTTIWDI